MIFKRIRSGLSLVKKAMVDNDDFVDTEEMEQDTDRVADALLTPMGDGQDRHIVEEVNAPIPLVGDEEAESADKVADSLLTPMGDGDDTGLTHRPDEAITPEGGAVGGDGTEVKDIFAQSTQQENPSPSEQASDKAPEKAEEAVMAEPTSESKGGLMSDLFDQEEEVEESPIRGLIASLPEIPVQEVLTAAEEVKALMDEWQSSGPD
jgi:hypothetical protein